MKPPKMGEARAVSERIGQEFAGEVKRRRIAICHSGGQSGTDGQSGSDPSTLFSSLAPILPDPPDDELARRVFMLWQQPDPSSRRQPLSLYDVFHYYCVKELTIPHIGADAIARSAPSPTASNCSGTKPASHRTTPPHRPAVFQIRIR